LYQLKNPQILQTINAANEQLENILNPKKRIILLTQTRLMQREMHGELNERGKYFDEKIKNLFVFFNSNK
jgi:precorrin-6B methylase 1